jgi:hypothetical protein
VQFEKKADEIKNCIDKKDNIKLQTVVGGMLDYFMPPLSVFGRKDGDMYDIYLALFSEALYYVFTTTLLRIMPENLKKWFRVHPYLKKNEVQYTLEFDSAFKEDVMFRLEADENNVSILTACSKHFKDESREHLTLAYLYLCEFVDENILMSVMDYLRVSDKTDENCVTLGRLLEVFNQIAPATN